MLATPCATSSAFGRWRRPVMPSATVAERSDSIAPSSAKLPAQGSAARSDAGLISGSPGRGGRRGSAPKREPIVSTGRPKAATAPEASAIAMIIPGQPGRKRRKTTISATVAPVSAAAAGVKVARASQSAASLGRIAAGSAPPRSSPSALRICEARMMTPIPALKATVTG